MDSGLSGGVLIHILAVDGNYTQENEHQSHGGGYFLTNLTMFSLSSWSLWFVGLLCNVELKLSDLEITPYYVTMRTVTLCH